MWKTHNNNKGCAFGDYIRFFNKENMYKKVYISLYF